MPRYYFNTRIGDELISDPDGEVLVDPDRAWEMARAMIRELLKTDGADGALLSAIIEVTDDDGEIVLEFPFSEAILDAPGRLDHQTLKRRNSGRHRTDHSVDAASAAHVSGCLLTKNIGDWRSGKPTGAGAFKSRAAENQASARENYR